MPWTLLASLLTGGVFKNFMGVLGIILCIVFGFGWRNAVELLEIRTVLFEERLAREQSLGASWEMEALRLQELVNNSSNAVQACLEREREEAQTQVTLRGLIQDLRTRAKQKIRMDENIKLAKPPPTNINDSLSPNINDRPNDSPNTCPNICSGHEHILEYLERPLTPLLPSQNFEK